MPITTTITQDNNTLAELLSRFHVMNLAAEFISGDIQFVPELGGPIETIDFSQQTVQGDQEFLEQKRAFQAISRERLAEYQGRFIASQDGVIVDNDEDLNALTERFFRKHGDVPVYITKIGGSISLTIHTPLGE